MEEATFAGGCFWCIEAPFKRVEGVESATSGYTGGDTPNPTYKEVCSGTTGHAEAVRVVYDSDEVTYRELLELFFTLHDPTTLNREGPDVGSQYRSAVFYHNQRQRDAVESYIEELEKEGVYDGIVTEVSPTEEFYVAEEYHQDYYEKNPNDGYCRVNVQPKIKKTEKEFNNLVSDD
jgi:peptide-methionine (S)-S-oxide reductase